MKNLNQKSEIICSLLDVDVRYAHIDEDKCSLISDFQPEFINREGETLLTFAQQLPTGHVIHTLEGSYGSLYFAMKLEHIALLIGPYCLHAKEQASSYTALADLSISASDLHKLEAYLQKRPTLEEKIRQHWAQIISSLFANDLATVSSSCCMPLANQNNPIAAKPFDSKFIKKVTSPAHYDTELKLYSYVRQGDIQSVRDIISQGEGAYRMPRRVKDLLVDSKYLCITLNSLCSRAAYQGGVDEEIITFLSSRYVKMIERQTQPDGIAKLFAEIPTTYCQSTFDYSLNKYSLLVKKAIRSIRIQLFLPLSLTQIAKELFVSKEHLSRVFKKETGETVSWYINRLKINESLRYLQSGTSSVGEISEMFGYSSPNYYYKIFQKVMKCTPKGYLETAEFTYV